MRMVCATIFLLVALVSPVAVASAAAQSAGVAPTRIPIAGVLQTATGEPRTGSVLLVLSLYDGRDDLAPRWIEHQVVTLDEAGGYNVEFGATRQEGLPPELFSGAPSAQWVGVGVENEAEQPRMMMVSVPYAAKAVSADTLAGKPASEFVLSTNLADQVRTAFREDASGGGAGEGGIGNAVTLNFLQKGDGLGGTTDANAVDVGGNIGIGTATPSALLDVAGTTLAGDGTLSLEAGGRLTTQAGNDLNIVAPNTRSIFLRIGSPDNPRVEIDNIGRLGLGLSGAPPTQLFDASGTTVSFDGTLSLEAGGKLTTAAGNDLNIDTPVNRSLYLKNGGTVKTTITSTGMHVSGNVTVDGNIGAKYQDVAEWVESPESLEAGSIVVIDVSSLNRVVAATKSYDMRVAGAVSAQPGIVLGEVGEGKVLVAQSGRVRIKADARNGAIRPGDLLVSSPTRGHAMRSRPVRIGGQLVHRPGTLIGKALEALPAGRGEILVLLTLQ